jgi:hypothetical protein
MRRPTRPARCHRERPSPWVVLLITTLGLSGCATMQDAGQSLVPNTFQTQTGPFAVYANKPVGPDAEVIQSLKSLERNVRTSLGVHVAAGTPPVEIYILKDREAFNHFLMFYYPELPPRRAFFLAQGPRRVVYTYYNDRLDEDLRHEATHALLNVALGDLPLWLDEGLAEYFEGPSGHDGLNPEHLARLPDDRKAGWQPDLVRLETLTTVREMTPRDYRESWAWVHYLLNGPPSGKQALLAFLAAPTSTTAPRLSDRVAAANKNASGLMLTHLERLNSAPAEVSSVRSEPSYHFQNAPVEPPAKRGLLDRLLGAMGLR